MIWHFQHTLAFRLEYLVMQSTYNSLFHEDHDKLFYFSTICTNTYAYIKVNDCSSILDFKLNIWFIWKCEPFLCFFQITAQTYLIFWSSYSCTMLDNIEPKSGTSSDDDVKENTVVSKKAEKRKSDSKDDAGGPKKTKNDVSIFWVSVSYYQFTILDSCM